MALTQGAIKLKQAIVQNAVQICKMARSRVHFYEKITLCFNRVHFRGKNKLNNKTKELEEKNKLKKNLRC